MEADPVLARLDPAAVLEDKHDMGDVLLVQAVRYLPGVQHDAPAAVPGHRAVGELDDPAGRIQHSAGIAGPLQQARRPGMADSQTAGQRVVIEDPVVAGREGLVVISHDRSLPEATSPEPDPGAPRPREPFTEGPRRPAPGRPAQDDGGVHVPVPIVGQHADRYPVLPGEPRKLLTGSGRNTTDRSVKLKIFFYPERTVVPVPVPAHRQVAHR